MIGKQYPHTLAILNSYDKISARKRRTRIYRILEDLTANREFVISEKDIRESVIKKADERPFTDEETVLFMPIIADIISRALSNIKNLEGDYEKTLINRASALLRSFELVDIESLRERISVLDRTLSARNCNAYAQSSDLTKSLVRSRISAFAKRHRISEKDAALVYCENGCYLEDKIIRKKNARLYFSLWVILTLAITFVICLASQRGPFFFIILLLPISESVKLILDRIFSRFIPQSTVARLKLDTIPSNAKVLTVITSLISDKDSAIFDQIEQFYLANRDENAYYGLLLDLPEADSEYDEKDVALIDLVKERFDLLNQKYKDKFYVFIRDRVRVPSENSYMGRERKRGALIDLVSFLREKNSEFSVLLGNKELISDVKYVITLDRDTRLYKGAVRDMVSAMLHPRNRPKIKNGVVTSGYAIMQPRTATSLASFSKSYFSSFSSRGGVDPYQSASFDFYQSLFDEGIFCGKGIFDVDVYFSLIPDAFCDGVILSHDLLEGTRLRCGVLSDVVLTDAHPTTPSAFWKRLHRWIRGDIQSTLYASKYVLNKERKTVKNPISSLSKFFIFDNVRRALVPVCACIALVAAALGTSPQTLIAVAALSYTLVAPIHGILRSVRGVGRRFFSHVRPAISSALWDFFFGVASVFCYASVSADALIKGFFRSRISGKKTLEWSVSFSEKKSGVLPQISWGLISYILGALILVFAESPVLKCGAILWIFMPAILLALSFYVPRSPKPSSSDKAVLLRYLFDSWSFFATYVNEKENFLPPDNVQEFPTLTIAHRTSPTNIGMYMVSCLAACDCGFIDPHTLAYRLENTLSTIESLPKKHGHLYNWYDTKKLTVLGSPYVSTVDSGNFAVALTALYQGLSDYRQQEERLIGVRERIKKILDATDFSFLYSQKRDLFYIGMDAADEVSEENCYDLLMSEIRSTCYYAIAKDQIDVKNWRKMGRPIIGHKGYIGVASWSGSMFEYFMPHLFLPLYDSSLMGEALIFATNAQIEDKVKGFWGVSESAYYTFDNAMNYQYKANGVSRLALDPIIGKEKVISPYSSFLCLSTAKRKAIKNLEKLRSFGAYGKHGFYESVDFTRLRVGTEPETVKCYMAHHVGMSVIAATNFCFDNIFVKRFMSDAEMSSISELLCESVPTEAGISKNSAVRSAEAPPIRYPSTDKTLKSSLRSGQIPSVCTLASNDASITVSDAGHVMLTHRNILITRDPFDTRDMYSTENGLQIFFATDANKHSFTPDTMNYSGSKILLRSQLQESGEKLSCSATFTLCASESAYCIKLDASGKFNKFTPMIAFETVLSSAMDRESHPFYNGLSVESFYDRENSLLCFRCRSKDGTEERWISVSLENSPYGVEFDTRSDILPLNYSKDDLCDLLFKDLPSREGACISPFCILKGRETPCRGKFSCEFLITYGATHEDIVKKVLFVRKNSGHDISSFFAGSMYKLSQNRLNLVNVPQSYLKYADFYLAALCFRPNGTPPTDKTFSKNSLWSYGISGDLPIVALDLPSELSPSCKKICDVMIRLHRLLRLRGKKSDLVFIVSEKDAYNSHNRNRLSAIISECGASEYFCRHGGIFTVGENSREIFSSVSALYIPLENDSSIEEIFHSFMKRSLRVADDIKISRSARFDKKDGFDVYGGTFTEDGFLINKSRADLVWSYIYANRTFGTVLTQNSLGYTWFANSKEKRLTPAFSSYRRDICGERLIFVSKSGEKYDLIASSYSCEFTKGCAIYKTEINGCTVKSCVGVDEKLQVKLIYARAEGDLSMLDKIVYSVDPVIGENICQVNLILKKQDARTEFFRRRYDSHLSEHTVFLTSLDKRKNGSSLEYGFIFGIFPSFSDRAYYHIQKVFQSCDDILHAFEKYSQFYRDLFSKIQIESGDRALDLATNYYIPYQVFSARLFGRTGFYQSSGAYGFRDQLQDSLATLYYDGKFCKYQILRAAAHQYTEGDVQHWWHNSQSSDNAGLWHAGLRSKCSDDLLWLPYTVARYIDYTGDSSILDLRVRYIESRELDESENTRYERPFRSKYRESVYNHCIRAIERALRRGPNSLILMGSCDWNDGYDRVGAKGRGESVWLSQFMRALLIKFVPICKSRGDTEGAKKYEKIAAELSDAVENAAFDGDRYMRAFYDDGKPMGKAGDKECEIDLLPQAFAAIYGKDRSRAKLAMESACDMLWDRNNKIVKLFSPAFSGKYDDPGYIVGYCEGLRENGGQYTHAVFWAILGLLALGDNEKAFGMLCDINPINISSDEKRAVRYKTEPYALCGDVYSNPEHTGRGGWSLYTGSASWFVQAVLGGLIGISRDGEGGFLITPKFSDKFDKVEVTFSDKGQTKSVKLTDSPGNENGKIFFNGPNISK
ncbi:MAG: hypothetical protein E7626_06155 [Ruminococcaceae bacterium]|nr:hypothetical protein [Oscillospiraceae bacterium]